MTHPHPRLLLHIDGPIDHGVHWQGAFPACPVLCGSVIGVGRERDESDTHLFSLPSYLAQGLKGGPRHQFTTDWGWEISLSPPPKRLPGK